MDSDVTKLPAAEGSAAPGPSSSTKKPKRFEIKKWNAVALWAWDIVVDNCAICRNHIMDLCERFLCIYGGHRQGSSTKVNEQPLSEIAIYEAVLDLHENASVKASPHVLGLRGEDTEWVTIQIDHPEPSADDWVAVFSPAKFNGSNCSFEDYT